MDLTPLESFLAIAREGNLTRASRAMHLSQPALSAQLARLEGELGTPLFHRTPKGMALTRAGAVFREHVEDALRRLEAGRDAVHALQELARGSLAVGGGATATTYLLPPLLRRYHVRHPGISLYVREAGSQAVVEAVLTGELDLGVVTLPMDPRAARLVAVDPWVDDDLRLIVPPTHRLAGAGSFRWSELRDEPMVLFEAGTAVRRMIDEALDDAGVAVQIVMELRSIESIKQMVAQGIGSAFVSRYALPDERAGLQPARGPRDRLHRQLAVVVRQDRSPSAAAAAFLSELRV